jgi:hypothetical protein
MLIIAKAIWRIIFAGGLLLGGVESGGTVGALAIGSCGAFGFSGNHPSEVLAHADAITTCPGGDCQIIATIRRQCIAVAFDAEDVCIGYAWATGITTNEAKIAALGSCRKSGRRKCFIATSFCDTRGD